MNKRFFFGFHLSGLLLLPLAIGSGRLRAADILPPGFNPEPLGVHALVGGRVVVKPGEVLETGTVIIRDGLIEIVGRDVTPPSDARVWDLKGQTIYAGFIDAYVVPAATNPPVATTDTEPIGSPSATLTDGGGVKFFGVSGAQTDMGAPGPGYAIAKITPEHRAVREYSPRDRNLSAIRELGFTTAVIAPARGIIRGSSALVALVDENPNEAVIKPEVFQHIAFDTRDTEERSYPGSLMGAIAAIRQSCLDARHYARRLAEYQQNPRGHTRPPFDPALEALAPALNKQIRVAFEPGSALMVSRSGKLAGELGMDYCIVASGQEWRRPDLVKATAATFIVPLNFPTLPKLPVESDWDQVTLDQLRNWDWAAENPAVLRTNGLEIALTTYGLTDKKKFRPNLRLALDRGLSETDALAGLTTVPAKLCGVADRLGTVEAGKFANLTVVEGNGFFNPENKVRAVWIDGRIYLAPPEDPKDIKAAKTSDKEGKPKEKDGDEPKKEKEGDKEGPAKKEQLREAQKTRVARAPLDGRGVLAAPPAVLIRHTTLWTCGPQGVLTNADLLVVDGKIKSVGESVATPPAGALVIEGDGLHVSPGIIDCHSHTAVVGSVNEGSLPSTAMVRIRDVVNSETGNLYEQLAGGVTAVNLLHGSANPIGGQNCVIKLRDGAGPDDLVFADAPPGIKFALGENVKQSNWGDRFTTRFPQSRMGVQTFISNRFAAARAYLDAKHLAESKGKLPPRPDLELEALGEILEGKRWIHCHSYRQSEILMLIRLMQELHVQIGTFQHVLEGYKVADEIARMGTGGSTFSDWWAYKFEVYEAIPQNGSLMRDRGVVVSFNSDSSELARRLYLEAAKAVKYGDTPEPEALKFVTLNPAKQLRIDKRVGSLEVGKDADFALWSHAPLDASTVCEQTWIDGRKYFDRSLASERASKLDKERESLIAKAKKIQKLGGGGGGAGGGDERAGAEPTDWSFFRVALEHEFDHRDRHCMDGIED